MARRKRTNKLIVISILLLVVAILGYAGIHTYAPAEGDIWPRLKTGCLLLAAVAVVLWVAGYIQRSRKNGMNGQ